MPVVGEWTTIEVGQRLVASNIIYYINIDEKEVLSYRNSKPAEFENVKVFAASNWYTPVSGLMRNLLIQNKNDGT